jgi:hypothetical protein
LVSSSQSAAQLIILSSGEPVISMWGWSGSDKAMTLTKLKELVEKGELHYIQIGGGGPGGGNSVSSEVTEWVQKNGTAVQESEYSSTSDSGSDSDTDSSSQTNQSSIYRLDPSDAG